MFKWEKLGQVFNPVLQGQGDWMAEQAQNPFSLILDNCVRVYFNCRTKKDADGKSKSYAGFVDLDKDNLFNILHISSAPVLEHGAKGEFDEFGIMAGSVMCKDEEFYLYYVGWSRLLSVPYNWAIGLAKSINGTSFKRVGQGPILAANNQEPFLQAGCSALLFKDGVYHLWYTSGIKWIETESKPESVYQIMHAVSSDGINWNREGVAIIDSVIENEAQASPTVIKIEDRWHMFFSYRHSVDFRNKDRGYRLGYAWSEDLKQWHRDDSKAGLNVSDIGWDSEMVCYPHVNKINDEIYMFYCGNDFGKEGFGIAKLLI